MDPHNTPVALEMAFLLGALHALEPGHGKTALFAYMADGKKHLGHSILLGLASGSSHTLSIVGFAFFAHLISHFATGGHQDSAQLTLVFTWLSGLLMIGIGVYLLVNSRKSPHSHCCAVDKTRKVSQGLKLTAPRKSIKSSFKPENLKFLPLANDPKRNGSLKVSALLGASGGLMPCPSALATYLSGFANGNTSDALIAILVFAIGIAVCVSMVGVVFRLVGSKVRSLKVSRLSFRSWSTAQALIILGVGLFYTTRAAYVLISPELTSTTSEHDHIDLHEHQKN